MSIIDQAEIYAKNCHRETRQLYDGHPYEFHLQMVVDIAREFSYLLPPEAIEDVLAASWVHDCIEDCRQTYNDVKRATNERVAEIAFAVTTEKGKTRKERANEKYYEGIRNTAFAPYVKICDRMANMKYSQSVQSRMLEVYKGELETFENYLSGLGYDEMLAELRMLSSLG